MSVGSASATCQEAADGSFCPGHHLTVYTLEACRRSPQRTSRSMNRLPLALQRVCRCLNRMSRASQTHSLALWAIDSRLRALVMKTRRHGGIASRPESEGRAGTCQFLKSSYGPGSLNNPRASHDAQGSDGYLWTGRAYHCSIRSRSRHNRSTRSAEVWTLSRCCIQTAE